MSQWLHTRQRAPSTCVTFLGTLVDTGSFKLCLPPEKVGRFQALLRTWSIKKVCKKEELESLLGHLSHAASVVRTFLHGVMACGLGWFQMCWPDTWTGIEILAKELVPVVAAAARWGSYWSGKHICFHSDNIAVVSVLQTRASKNKLLMPKLDTIVFTLFERGVAKSTLNSYATGKRCYLCTFPVHPLTCKQTHPV